MCSPPPPPHPRGQIRSFTKHAISPLEDGDAGAIEDQPQTSAPPAHTKSQLTDPKVKAKRIKLKDRHVLRASVSLLRPWSWLVNGKVVGTTVVTGLRVHRGPGLTQTNLPLHSRWLRVDLIST